MTSDRERKLEYIKEDGGNANIRRRVISMLTRHGADWLTDEQIDDLFHAESQFQEARERLNAENKARAQALADARRRDLREKVLILISREERDDR